MTTTASRAETRPPIRLGRAARTVATRLLQLAATLLVASFLTFMALQAAPGDPVDIILGGKASDPDAARRVTEQFGLDDPVLLQYWHWLSGALHGDLGRSFLFNVDVSSLVSSRLPTTMLLVVMSSVLVIVSGFFLGLVAARSRHAVDGAITTFLSIAMATPTYVIAIMLITVFSLHFTWFPVFGSGTGGLDRVHHLVLPAVTLALSSSAAVARVTRASILEEEQRDHVATAVARGLGRRTVLTRHVIRNALLPVTTIAGIVVAALVAGTVIVEKAYGLDGIGSLLVLSVTRKDYAVVQSVSVLVIAAFLLVNLLVDALYGFIDPRTRTRRTS